MAVVENFGVGATGSTGVNAKLYFLGSSSWLFYLLNFEILRSPVNCCLHLCCLSKRLLNPIFLARMRSS